MQEELRLTGGVPDPAPNARYIELLRQALVNQQIIPADLDDASPSIAGYGVRLLETYMESLIEVGRSEQKRGLLDNVFVTNQYATELLMMAISEISELCCAQQQALVQSLGEAHE